MGRIINTSPVFPALSFKLYRIVSNWAIPACRKCNLGNKISTKVLTNCLLSNFSTAYVISITSAPYQRLAFHFKINKHGYLLTGGKSLQPAPQNCASIPCLLSGIRDRFRLESIPQTWNPPLWLSKMDSKPLLCGRSPPLSSMKWSFGNATACRSA